MILLHTFENLKTFLYDQDEFIAIYKNKIHIFSYIKIQHFSIDYISILFANFKLNIKGENLKIINMQESEMIIKGIINNLEFKYEKYN